MKQPWQTDFPDVNEQAESLAIVGVILMIIAWFAVVVIAAYMPTIAAKLAVVSFAFLDYARPERQQLLQRETKRARLLRICRHPGWRRMFWLVIGAAIGYIGARMLGGRP